MFHYVYILQSPTVSGLYVGYTKYLRRRLKEHNGGRVSFTANGHTWQLIHYEAYMHQQDATRREKYLKTSQGSRLLKRMLKEFLYTRKSRVSTS